MTGLAAPPRQRLAMLVTLGVHAMVLALVLMPAHVVRKSPAPRMIMVTDVPVEARKTARTVPIKTPSRATQVPERPKLSSVAPFAIPAPMSPEDRQALSDFEPTAGSAGVDEPCDLATALANDLRQAPAAQRALLAVPASARSVADAIMMWDGQWPGDTQAGGKALLRALIEREIAAARSRCLDEINHGPHLFLVPASGTTVAIVVGSGEWRWRDLLAAS
jgi:hypothetical protein